MHFETGTIITYQGKRWRVNGYASYNGEPAYWIERDSHLTEWPIIVEAKTLEDEAKPVTPDTRTR